MLLDLQHSKVVPPHCMATSQLTIKQNIQLNSSIVDINHCLNKVLSAFNTLNSELKPGQCLADLFPDHFSFNTVKCSDPIARRVHLNKLNKVYFTSLSNDNTILVIADAGVRNNITTSVTHIYRGHSIIKRTCHQAMNILPTEAELFAIRYGIN